ncbi:transcriptional adapter 3-like [Sitodiplosis mosellana]|uniref:transcriptional adapter 3-like n=1 Tax=Sitodiplosis mosellana TaxID=263140 RepID=UPI0024442EF3|nr:transcriptional adapter 3-like [Sitodiplosis mosellana]
MSSSPAKHKSSHHHHHHHHHHHREHHHSGDTTIKPIMSLASHIKIEENSRRLPRYSFVLSNVQDDCLPLEELDAIQMELEVLLSSVSLRYRALKTDYDYLEHRKHQKKNAEKEKQSGSKRKRDDKKSSSKDSNRHSHTKHSKIKSSSSNSPAQQLDQSIDAMPSPSAGGSHPNPKLLLPKNDVPNKFWLSVEPYCMPITQEDIKFLDDLIDEYTDPLVPSIPELGSHYAVRWAANDEDNAKSKRLQNSNVADDAMKKGSEKMMGQGVCGPLTQRLLSALLEDSSDMQSDVVGCSDALDSNDSCAENNPSSANRAQNGSITSLFKGGIDVEKRLKKELLDLGIFEPSDFAKEKEDEVLNEIKRVRTELQAIAEFNRNELKTLKAVAKDEMKRLDMKRKLDRIDQEIIEAYKRIFAAKQKRRPLTKHERNEIYRLVDEQKRLADQLETMPNPGFNFAVGSTVNTSAPMKAEPPSKA